MTDAYPIYKLNEAIGFLDCSINDLLEKWSFGEVFLCVNIAPPIKVIKTDINNELIIVDQDREVLCVTLDPYGDETNLEVEEVYGTYYFLPKSQKYFSGFFVLEKIDNSVKLEEKVVSLNNAGSVFINPIHFDRLLNNNSFSFENLIKDSYIIKTDSNYDKINNFGIKLNDLRMSKAEIDRTISLNLFGKTTKNIQEEIKDNERNNLLMTIGALSEMYVDEKGSSFKSGDKPNVSRITDNLLKHLQGDIYGLKKSALNKRISDGIKLLQRAKKES